MAVKPTSMKTKSGGDWVVPLLGVAMEFVMLVPLPAFLLDLLLATRDGTLKSTETAEPGVYRLMLEKGLVRIYHLGPPSTDQTFVRITILDAKGKLLTAVQVPRQGAENLAALYDLMHGRFQ